jgi:hypothetical protein
MGLRALLVVVDVVADQISKVLAHIAIDLQRLQVLRVALQGQHQQPQRGQGVWVHDSAPAGTSLRAQLLTRSFYSIVACGVKQLSYSCLTA